MEEFTREKQIEKISSLINRRGVSRRDFFGSLGKMVILSQVVALGASSFLASCIALEDKKGFGNIKFSIDECTYLGPDNVTNTCQSTEYGGIGFECGQSSFACEQFQCKQTFTCVSITAQFDCKPPDFGGQFDCGSEGSSGFSCGGNHTHNGGCGNT